MPRRSLNQPTTLSPADWIAVFTAPRPFVIPLTSPDIRFAPNSTKRAAASAATTMMSASHAPKPLPALVALSRLSLVESTGPNIRLIQSHAPFMASTSQLNTGLSGSNAEPRIASTRVKIGASGFRPSDSPCQKPEKNALIGSQYLTTSSAASAMPAITRPIGLINATRPTNSSVCASPPSAARTPLIAPIVPPLTRLKPPCATSTAMPDTPRRATYCRAIVQRDTTAARVAAACAATTRHNCAVYWRAALAPSFMAATADTPHWRTAARTARQAAGTRCASDAT
ncbi:hypothetical protein FEQ05_05801 [Burkholderia pseudomultivorans]|nr:hypothetical protein [Burkholderia pseudomultivorans]